MLLLPWPRLHSGAATLQIDCTALGQSVFLPKRIPVFHTRAKRRRIGAHKDSVLSLTRGRLECVLMRSADPTLQPPSNIPLLPCLLRRAPAACYCALCAATAR